MLSVKVDNTAVPADRWYSGCGIYRPVHLLELPAAHLDEREIVVHTAWEEGRAAVTVDTGVRLSVEGELSPWSGQAFETEDAANCPPAERNHQVCYAKGEDGMLRHCGTTGDMAGTPAPALFGENQL